MTPLDFTNKWRKVEPKERTLTDLYNAHPACLDHAHNALDEGRGLWPGR